MSSSVHESRINQVGKLILNHYQYIIVGYLDAIRWAPRHVPVHRLLQIKKLSFLLERCPRLRLGPSKWGCMEVFNKNNDRGVI